MLLPTVCRVEAAFVAVTPNESAHDVLAVKRLIRKVVSCWSSAWCYVCRSCIRCWCIGGFRSCCGGIRILVSDVRSIIGTSRRLSVVHWLFWCVTTLVNFFLDLGICESILRNATIRIIAKCQNQIENGSDKKQSDCEADSLSESNGFLVTRHNVHYKNNGRCQNSD